MLALDALSHIVRGATPCYGVFCATPDPAVAEILAQAGYDFICIDSEHGALDRADMSALARAAAVHDVPTMVRVAANSPELIAAALDAGAQGILVPRISDAAEAVTAAISARYPPTGKRGVGPGRASGYGLHLAEYVAKADSNTIVAVQIETAAAVSDIDNIVRAAGVDLVFIGPGDLAVSLGTFGQDTDASRGTFDSAVQSVAATASAAHRPLGAFCTDVAEVPKWRGLGATTLIVRTDQSMLADTARRSVAEIRTITS